MLMNRAWEGLYKAKIVEEVRGLYAQLVNPSQARKDAVPDDFIRGQIQALKWAIEWPDQEMNRAVLESAQADKEEAEFQKVVPLFGGGHPGPGKETLNGNG